MYHVSAQGVDERMINAHYYYYFSPCHVKEFSSKSIKLEVDVIGLENVLFAGASVHLSARKFYKLGQ